MQELGAEALPRAGLSPHQDADAGGGGASDELAHAAHRGGVADQDLVDLERPLERAVLLSQAVEVDRERAELARGVDRGSRERRERAEEAAVLLVQGAAPLAARLAVGAGDGPEGAPPPDRRGAPDATRLRP